MAPPDRATFRLPGSALFIPIGLFFVSTPLAAASIWTVWLYLLPLYGVFYVLWTKTVADAQRITVFGPFGIRRIHWADLDGFEFAGPRWAMAVTLNGKRIRLPMVRPRDLRRLAEVSGGRLLLGEEATAAAEASLGSSTSVVGAYPAGTEAAGPDSAGDAVPGAAVGSDVQAGSDVEAPSVAGAGSDAAAGSVTGAGPGETATTGQTRQPE